MLVGRQQVGDDIVLIEPVPGGRKGRPTDGVYFVAHLL